MLGVNINRIDAETKQGQINKSSNEIRLLESFTVVIMYYISPTLHINLSPSSSVFVIASDTVFFLLIRKQKDLRS